jgi:hypothetical protein
VLTVLVSKLINTASIVYQQCRTLEQPIGLPAKRDLKMKIDIRKTFQDQVCITPATTVATWATYYLLTKMLDLLKCEMTPIENTKVLQEVLLDQGLIVHQVTSVTLYFIKTLQEHPKALEEHKIHQEIIQ